MTDDQESLSDRIEDVAEDAIDTAKKAFWKSPLGIALVALIAISTFGGVGKAVGLWEALIVGLAKPYIKSAVSEALSEQGIKFAGAKAERNCLRQQMMSQPDNEAQYCTRVGTEAEAEAQELFDSEHGPSPSNTDN